MKRIPLHITAILLAICFLLGSGAPVAQASNPGDLEYINTYVNTGNQREDIIGVALTQLGYREKYDNDTKYGDWFGCPYTPWCAMFVSWCARQADISTDILRKNSWANPDSYGIPYYHGSQYTPQPGDLFFTEDFGHVGLVWYVEGEFFYCLEGNGKAHDYQAPDDPSEESYYVLCNKRLTRDYYFGVPNYQGCDTDHNYAKGQDAAHPHKTYYECQTCGDLYYTGYTECVADCPDCFSCGCSSSYTGYYMVTSNHNSIRMRAGHTVYSDCVGQATTGAVVYVHGANPSTGWAYVEYDNLRGHMMLDYLTPYHNIPDAPLVTSEKTNYRHGDQVTVTWTAPDNTEQFRLAVFRDGVLYSEAVMDMAQTLTLESLSTGQYEVRVTARNQSGVSDDGVLKFVVRALFTVTYDARGGTEAPAAQSQEVGESLTLTDQTPIRDGYTFLGWTTDPLGHFAEYPAGTDLVSQANMTLYAVWRENKTQSFRQPPEHTLFLPDKELDAPDLALKLMYSNDSGHWHPCAICCQEPFPWEMVCITEAVVFCGILLLILARKEKNTTAQAV